MKTSTAKRSTMARRIAIGCGFGGFLALVANAQDAPAIEDRVLVQAWAETETVLASPIVGLVQQIPNHVGQKFAKGEVLVSFDCTENEARAAIAQSELTAANETLEAKIRLKALDAAADIEVTVAAAGVAKAEAQDKLSKYQVTQCQMKAPFDGYVTRILGNPFQTTTVGQPLLEIISAGTPRLRVIADSALFTRFQIGSALRITIAETGLEYDATVQAINARIDSVNQTFEMEAQIEGDAAGLLPGMSGIAVIDETKGASEAP